MIPCWRAETKQEVSIQGPWNGEEWGIIRRGSGTKINIIRSNRRRQLLETMFEVAGPGLLLTATRGQAGRIEGGHKGAVAVMHAEGLLPRSLCIY